MILWLRDKPMARDVTVPDTVAESHLGNTAREPGAAANKASAGKVIKYGALSCGSRDGWRMEPTLC